MQTHVNRSTDIPRPANYLLNTPTKSYLYMFVAIYQLSLHHRLQKWPLCPCNFPSSSGHNQRLPPHHRHPKRLKQPSLRKQTLTVPVRPYKQWILESQGLFPIFPHWRSLRKARNKKSPEKQNRSLCSSFWRSALLLRLIYMSGYINSWTSCRARHIEYTKETNQRDFKQTKKYFPLRHCRPLENLSDRILTLGVKGLRAKLEDQIILSRRNSSRTWSHKSIP